MATGNNVPYVEIPSQPQNKQLMITELGFKFRPTFASDIDHFEVRGYDEVKNHILTTVYMNSGHHFEDSIELDSYEAAFEIGEYVPIE